MFRRHLNLRRDRDKTVGQASLKQTVMYSFARQTSVSFINSFSATNLRVCPRTVCPRETEPLRVSKRVRVTLDLLLLIATLLSTATPGRPQPALLLLRLSMLRSRAVVCRLPSVSRISEGHLRCSSSCCCPQGAACSPGACAPGLASRTPPYCASCPGCTATPSRYRSSCRQASCARPWASASEA
eukprot:3729928-Pleurochrysis_carterae.AAC.4